MQRHFGVSAHGIRLPIVKAEDDLETIIFESLIAAFKHENIKVNNGDIIGITESIVARAQNNYATLVDISLDVKRKVGSGPIGLVFPILSRNRFLSVLEAISKGVDSLIIQLSYPTDEVGNRFINDQQLHQNNINPYQDVFNDQQIRKLLGGRLLHPITKCDYPAMYQKVSRKIKIIYANNPTEILKHTNKVIVANVHNREQTKQRLIANGAQLVIGLDQILTEPINNSGYHPQYGLLGSNYASQDKIKLFPRDGQLLVANLQKRFFAYFNKRIEVLIYGDGAYQDPTSHIWELADPVVTPYYTDGLSGTPHELKLKLLADETFALLNKEEAEQKINQLIHENKLSQTKQQSLGTTPRKVIDLLGSLCDLISGSGDKGTPVVYIQGYFDNYADN